MGDSDLTGYLAVAALGVMLVALILAGIAWRIRKRPVRIGIGLALIVLGSLCGLLSVAALILVGGLGVAVLVLGIRTVPADRTADGL